MTMQIRIKNDATDRVGYIQHWEQTKAHEPHSLQSADQLLPGEEKVVHIHSAKYITIQECEHKTTIEDSDNATKKEMVKILREG